MPVKGPRYLSKLETRPMPVSILIADDYDDNRELLRLMLEAEGYSIREARDGEEFVRMAREEVPDLALVDLSMPVLDGWKAMRELRADARTRAVPCIAITAFAAEQDRLHALASGFDAYLAKPFRTRDLLELVEQLLKTGAGRREGEYLTKSESDGGR